MAVMTCGSGGSTGSQITTQINDNTTQIATNVADIATNVTNIATNASNIATNVTDIAGKMEWKGTWVAASYILNDVVLDDGWLMIANKDTNERAAPQPVGTAAYVYQGTISSSQITAKQVLFGQRYLTAQAGYLSGIRIHTVVGNNYRIFTVKDPSTNPIIEEVKNFTADTDGWAAIAISTTIFGSGTELDIMAEVQEPNPTPTVWSASWNYTTPNNDGVPTTGVIIHSNASQDIININYIDNAATDRTTQLDVLLVGDIIELGARRWSIQSSTGQGTYRQFVVSPATQGASDGVQSFNFETTTATPITYAIDVDYNLGVVSTAGLYGADLPYSSLTPDDNQYGIDILFQPAAVSDDWDVMATSDSASGSTPAAPPEYESNTMNSVDDPQLADVGTAWTQGPQLDTTMPAGEYLMGYSFTYLFGSTSNSAEWQFSINGGTFETFSKESKDGADADSRMYLFPYSHAGGAVSFSVQFKKTGGTQYTVNYANVWIDRKV